MALRSRRSYPGRAVGDRNRHGCAAPRHRGGPSGRPALVPSVPEVARSDDQHHGLREAVSLRSLVLHRSRCPRAMAHAAHLQHLVQPRPHELNHRSGAGQRAPHGSCVRRCPCGPLQRGGRRRSWNCPVHLPDVGVPRHRLAGDPALACLRRHGVSPAHRESLARHLLNLRHPTPGELNRLEPLWREVTARTGVDGRAYELWIEDSDHLNSLAAASHILGVTRFSLERLSDGQLAAVLAHELGHHVRGHAWSFILGSGMRRRGGLRGRGADPAHHRHGP
ncbi:M48 family metalloprotease [Streptomyces sp. VTCC 41912]|uniref:M48 family metalloprotease n=1 Tax=Streptomyces sp. VTCC 41912 TaxID=3383243 RepID=UPI003896C095